MSSIVATELTYQQASSLRKGGRLMIKGHPCKIIEMTTHKSGKHGGAKCKFTAVGEDAVRCVGRTVWQGTVCCGYVGGFDHSKHCVTLAITRRSRRKS